MLVNYNVLVFVGRSLLVRVCWLAPQYSPGTINRELDELTMDALNLSGAFEKADNGERSSWLAQISLWHGA